MIRALISWLDQRTGYRELLRAALEEPIPGGARWRYVWGSTLVFTFALQVVTGICLWMAYSPGVQNAWASVLFIEQDMTCGALLRGMHHYAAQAMVVLLALHFLQVVLDGAYRAPREFNFWIGLVLAQVVLALALTGYLLPWDQKGYYATQVATKIAGATPLVGESVQRFIQGGPDYGQHTLTRFFAFHAGLFPSLLVVLLVVHLYLFRRHGITTRRTDTTDPGWFWPDQVLKDGVACLAVMAVVLVLALWRGAELGAPADPAENYAAARPEWYFLSLFRFLKFESVERLGLVFGAIVVPGLVATYFALMPFTARLPYGHRVNQVVTCTLGVLVAGLTVLAWWEDRTNPEHQAAVAEARRDAVRARQLAMLPARVPLEGPRRLLQEDPFTVGPRLFAAHCASCHLYQGHDGRGRIPQEADPKTGALVAIKPTAPDLGNLGSREWMRSILVDFENHFAPLRNAAWFGQEKGIDPTESEMADWSGDREALLSPENKENLRAVVEFLVAETGRRDVAADEKLVQRGRDLVRNGTWNGAIAGTTCLDCHDTIGEPFDPQSEGGSGYPDLAQYLSRPWLVHFLADPGTPQFYDDRNHMPAFRDRLSEGELDLLARWLTGDYVAAPAGNGEVHASHDEQVPNSP